MKKSIVSIFILLFLTGCFGAPYTTPGVNSSASNPYQSSVEEPTKMQSCGYSSLNGKEIILHKNPADNEQLQSTNRQMAIKLIPKRISIN